MATYDLIKNKNVITIAQGSTHVDTVTLTHANGTAYDLTGHTLRSQLRTLDGAIVGTFTCTVATPASGIISRTMLPAVTSLLAVAASVNHVWGIEITTAAGAILPEIQGGALITPEVVL